MKFHDLGEVERVIFAWLLQTFDLSEVMLILMRLPSGAPLET